MDCRQNGLDDKYRHVQKGLLKVFISICEKNDIPYYLAGGTLLGAVRNQEFIPWDDDLDVVVFREDYCRLCDSMERELEYPYEFQTSGKRDDFFMFGIARLRNSNTTAASIGELSDAPVDVNLGIWLDVPVLDRTYSNKWMRQGLICKIRFWQMMRAAKSYLKIYPRYWFMNSIKWGFFKVLAKKYSAQEIDNRIIKLIEKCKEEKYVASYAMHENASQTKVYERAWFGTGKKIQIAGVDATMPDDYDAVLKELYGADYIAPPPEEKQNSGHVGLILDAERPYTRYINLLRPGRWKKECANKTFVLFGSGQQANYFIEHEDKQYMPKCIVDNNSAKWGTTLHDIPIISPQELCEMDKDNLRIIIANIYWKEISAQLDELGIYDYYSYVNSAAWETK